MHDKVHMDFSSLKLVLHVLYLIIIIYLTCIQTSWHNHYLYSNLLLFQAVFLLIDVPHPDAQRSYHLLIVH